MFFVLVFSGVRKGGKPGRERERERERERVEKEKKRKNTRQLIILLDSPDLDAASGHREGENGNTL